MGRRHAWQGHRNWLGTWRGRLGGWEAPLASRPWGSSAPVTPPPKGSSRGRFPRDADECRWVPYKIGPGTGKGRAKGGCEFEDTQLAVYAKGYTKGHQYGYNNGYQNGSIRKLLSKTNYREPLELLACFLGDSRTDQCNTDALALARYAINEGRQQMRCISAFQDEGHPAVIIHTVMSRTEGHKRRLPTSD